ncbi:A-kinase anchor protein 8-like isoform X2 [Trichomycterus rosablanca]|uniref:A-kinase anchor protein 8-like isoform X2 n=1 Tax=Trichomycterus rosablanca TaxID=2290929 RepID=UPI002F34F586
MDGRGYGSGSGSYGMYGGGYGDTHMKGGLSGSNADAVIAKINQRLDMLSQLEGGMRGGRNDRFDQYESYDSRSSAPGPRDLYRSGNFGFGDSRADMMGYESMGAAGGRDSFSGSGWGEGPRSQHRGGRPDVRGFGRMQDDYMTGGGRQTGVQGHSPSGRGRLPSLLSHRVFPERGFQFKGSQFGGNQRGNRQQNRKRPHNRQGKQKDRKEPQSPSDEPEPKVSKAESAGDDDEDTVEPRDEKTDDGTPATESNPAAEDEDAETKSEDKPSAPRSRRRRGFFERTANGPSRSLTRVAFACSICKFRSFYSEDMEAHLESKFHKDHFKFLSSQLLKPTAEFLKEYLLDKYKKTAQRITQLPDHYSTICQVLKDQDLTREIGMEHFIKKEEAAHCTACDIYIPMQHKLIQQHIKAPEHNQNRKAMMEQSKWSCASVARSILNHKVISKKLETFLKGENPFTDDQDKQDLDDSMTLEETEGDGEPKEKPEEGAENAGEGAPEGAGNGQPKETSGDGGEGKEMQGEAGKEDDWAGGEEEEEMEAGDEVEGVELGEEDEDEGIEGLEVEDQEA